MRKQFYLNKKNSKVEDHVLGPCLDTALLIATADYMQNMCKIYLAQIISMNVNLDFDQDSYMFFEKRCNTLFNSLHINEFEIVYDETIWTPLDGSPRDRIKIVYKMNKYIQQHQFAFSISEIKKEYSL